MTLQNWVKGWWQIHVSNTHSGFYDWLYYATHLWLFLLIFLLSLPLPLFLFIRISFVFVLLYHILSLLFLPSWFHTIPKALQVVKQDYWSLKDCSFSGLYALYTGLVCTQLPCFLVVSLSSHRLVLLFWWFPEVTSKTLNLKASGCQAWCACVECNKHTSFAVIH